MTFYKHFSPLLAVVLALYSFSSVAQSQEKIVVVTNLNNDVQVLDKKGIIDLFMGKYSAFPNGRQATPIDIAVLRKSVSSRYGYRDPAY